jgi:hypothetical protein
MPIAGGPILAASRLPSTVRTPNRAGARGQVSPAGRAQLRGWLARFAGREEVTFAGVGITWRYTGGEQA